MATYYVQILSCWQGDRWRTAAKTEDKGLAEYLAEGLEIEKNQYGRNNPGDTGKRLTRCISKTRLMRDHGRPALLRAENDLGEGWEDSPRRPRERTPYPQFEYQGVLSDVGELEAAYREEQEEKEKAGVVDFLIRDMPGDLHQKLKGWAQENEVSMNEAIITAVQELLEKGEGK